MTSQNTRSLCHRTKSHASTPRPPFVRRENFLDASYPNSLSASIVSTIVQAIYAVRPVSSRQAEAKVLEGLLDKWYFELPSHLQYDPNNSSAKTPVPHILTLHMQYWCAVLLLHRPL